MKIIRHNQVYFSSSVILTYTGYTTVMSLKNLTFMNVVSVKTLEELKQTWLGEIICIFHSLNYDVNTDLLQRTIYIF